MPTRYRRVGVVLDPELSEAMALVRDRLGISSQASALRELALIGARSIAGGDGELEGARRALDKQGATRERGDLLAVSRRLRRREGKRSASETLEWVREQR